MRCYAGACRACVSVMPGGGSLLARCQGDATHNSSMIRRPPLVLDVHGRLVYAVSGHSVVPANQQHVGGSCTRGLHECRTL